MSFPVAYDPRLARPNSFRVLDVRGELVELEIRVVVTDRALCRTVRVQATSARYARGRAKLRRMQEDIWSLTGIPTDLLPLHTLHLVSVPTSPPWTT